MKCPNCGAEMKEGTLYCEHCGEDIHIVPDFEPEIEYNMEQTLHDIAREMTPEEDATDDQDAQQSMTELQDWDEEPLENTAKHPFRWKFIVLILVLAVVAVVCTGFGISYSHYHSAEYQIKSAREYVASGEYDQAITFNTSAVNSGSSAEVGSSKNRILGCSASALAMDTLCCCPPDSW